MSAVLVEFRAYVDKLFVRRRDGLEGVLHACVGMTGEAAECLDLVKKTWVSGKPLNDDKLLEEAGDALHYLVMLGIVKGWTLEDMAVRNVAKLDLRYPGGVYTDAANIARADTRARCTCLGMPGADDCKVHS